MVENGATISLILVHHPFADTLHLIHRVFYPPNSHLQMSEDNRFLSSACFNPDNLNSIQDESDLSICDSWESQSSQDSFLNLRPSHTQLSISDFAPIDCVIPAEPLSLNQRVNLLRSTPHLYYNPHSANISPHINPNTGNQPDESPKSTPHTLLSGEKIDVMLQIIENLYYFSAPPILTFCDYQTALIEPLITPPKNKFIIPGFVLLKPIPTNQSDPNDILSLFKTKYRFALPHDTYNILPFFSTTKQLLEECLKFENYGHRNYTFKSLELLSAVIYDRYETVCALHQELTNQHPNPQDNSPQYLITSSYSINISSPLGFCLESPILPLPPSLTHQIDDQTLSFNFQLDQSKSASQILSQSLQYNLNDVTFPTLLQLFQAIYELYSTNTIAPS